MKNVIQGTTLSGTGAVSIAPGAEITIRNPSGQLVPLWSDRAGTQPHDNPFLTDNEGNFRVYADSGWVHVRAQKDGSVREWRYVPLGSAAAMDIGEVYEALGAEVYSSVAGGLSESAEGDYFLVESSGSLDLYRVVNGVAEQRELGIEADAILATRAYADGVAAEAESNATNAAVAAASSAYQQATEYSDSRLQAHRESGDHDGRYYTKTEVDQALSTKVDDDDPRLSDPREWTAEVVSQSEAEEGASSVPRKWTAERVRQAVEAALAGGAAGIYTSVAEGLAATAEGNFFWVADQASEDVLTLYRVVESDAELWASLPRGDVVRELTDRAEAAAESAEQAAQSAQQDAQQTALDRTQTGQDAQTAQQAAQDAAEEADRAEAAADELELAKVPMFFVAWCPSRDHIWPGWVAADGQTLSSDTYPDASAGITAGAVPTTDDATWLADPTQRGKYVADDGSGYFRIPDYNGKLAGSIGAVYLTGDGAKSAGEAGLIREDQMQRITGEFQGGRTMDLDQGAFTSGDALLEPKVTSSGAAGEVRHYFDSANSPGARVGDYTHGTDVTGCWVIKLYGEVVNVGSADAEQLASDYANLNGAFQALDSQLDFTIIYPNGGTAEAPGTITVASRYVTPNPFPGHTVFCALEVLYDGEWVRLRARSSDQHFHGAWSDQHDDGDIVTVTGAASILTGGSVASRFAQSTAANVSVNQTTLPARVKVWKLKGAI